MRPSAAHAGEIAESGSDGGADKDPQKQQDDFAQDFAVVFDGLKVFAHD
jgi:hypothetical protein